MNQTWFGGRFDDFHATQDRWSSIKVAPYTHTETIDFAAKNKYFELLPINGYTYHSPAGKWKCEIVAHPESDEKDPGCYRLKFDPVDRAREPRYLALWVSVSALKNDLDWRYKTAITRIIGEWLAGGQKSGEIAVRS
jgi:hypothetical protein